MVFKNLALSESTFSPTVVKSASTPLPKFPGKFIFLATSIGKLVLLNRQLSTNFLFPHFCLKEDNPWLIAALL